MAGYSESFAHLICVDFDLAYAYFGRWVEKRGRETQTVPMPKSSGKSPTMEVARYKTLGDMLGIAPGEGGHKYQDGFTKEEMQDIDSKVEQFRRDPDALAEYLGLGT